MPYYFWWFNKIIYSFFIQVLQQSFISISVEHFIHKLYSKINNNEIIKVDA